MNRAQRERAATVKRAEEVIQEFLGLYHEMEAKLEEAMAVLDGAPGFSVERGELRGISFMLDDVNDEFLQNLQERHE